MQAIRPRFARVLCAFACAVFAVAGISSVGAIAAAATNGAAQSITLTPSSTELSAPPGGNTKGSFEVINKGDAAYTVSLSAAPYHVVGTAYDPQFTPLPGTSDASKWVHLTDPASRPLAARKSTSVDYTLTVPPKTAPGGYYAVLFAETTRSASSNGVVSHNRVGNILYITVQGPVKNSGEARTANLWPVTVASSLPLNTYVSNTGGIHFITTAKTTVKNVFGKTVFQSSLQRHVLPQTERLVSTSWNNAPPIGIFHIERSATVAGKTQQLTGQWILLIHPFLAIVFCLVIVAAAGWLVLRRKSRKKRG